MKNSLSYGWSGYWCVSIVCLYLVLSHLLGCAEEPQSKIPPSPPPVTKGLQDPLDRPPAPPAPKSHEAHGDRDEFLRQAQQFAGALREIQRDWEKVIIRKELDLCDSH